MTIAKHRHIIVTGAAAGLGRAITEELVNAGASVTCVDVDGARLAEVVGDLQPSRSAYAIKADLRDSDQCRAVYEEAVQMLGHIDAVVNNAGIGLHCAPDLITLPKAREIFAVNFFAATRLAALALPDMLARHDGCIVNISSVAGHIPTPMEAVYSASKAALWRWSHNVDLELRGTGVRVATLSPGPLDTEFWDKDGSRDSYRARLYPPQTAA